MSNIVDLSGLPMELITNHVIDEKILIPLLLTCKIFYDTLFEISCDIRDNNFGKVLYNKLCVAIKRGNTRAIFTLVNNPVMKLYNRKYILPESRLSEYCGLAHKHIEYTRAMKLISNHEISVDIDKNLYNILIWSAKSNREDLFDMILKSIKNKSLLEHSIENLITALISLESPYFIEKLLDYTDIKKLSNVWWKSSHENTKAVRALVDKLKPDIIINDYICLPNKKENHYGRILDIIWPYCRQKKIDIEAIVLYSIRNLTADHLYFITQKFACGQITPLKPYKINPLLIKIVCIRGYKDIAGALNQLNDLLVNECK